MTLRKRPVRSLRTWTPAVVAVFAFLGLVAPLPAAEVSVRESGVRQVIVDLKPPQPSRETLRGEDGTYVRLHMRGSGMTEEAGRPEVPQGSFQVALPPGTRPVLRVLSQQWSPSRPGAVTPLPERVAVHDPFGPNRVEELPPRRSALYRAGGTYPAVPFRLTDVHDVRGLRTVNVIWHGVQAETASDSYRVLESARLEIRFEPDPRRAAAPEVRAAPDELWDRTRRGTVVNADISRRWVRRTTGDGPSVGDTPWGGGNQVKVRVDATGLVRLRYQDLAAAGFPGGVPVAQVSVYQRTFDMNGVDDPAVAAADLFVPIDVPVQIRDDGNGIFDGTDSVVLYARSFRDQWMTSGWEHEDQFQTSNFYFVRADPAGGARMASRPAQIAAPAADSLAYTPATVFREEDRRYHDRPADFGVGAEAFESEFFYWNNGATATGGETGWSFNDPFDVVDPVAGRDASLTARVCGGGRPVLTNFSNIVTFTVNGTQVGEDSFYNNSLYATQVVLPDRVLWTHTIPAGTLTSGSNTFSFRGRTYSGNSLTNVFQVARFLFDWYEITYDRALVANGGGLLLSTENAAATDQRIRVRAFAGSDIRLFDVTDPAAPVSVAVDPSQIVPSGGSNSDLRFGHDNSVAPATYLAFRESSIAAAPAGNMTPIAPPTLLAGGNGARWVAVAFDDLVGATQELAAHRSAKHTTRVARLSEVYDVFGNGARHPDAIKAYSAYAYHRWTDPIAFLTLVGDASEDHRGITVESDTDYLPSHSLWASYEGAPEESDQYYAEVTRATPGTGPFDDLSDIYVGRMPVGSVEEMEWNVERIIRYETEDLDGAWRRRGLFLGDDAFSGSLGGGLGDPFAFKNIELNFCGESAAYVDSLKQQPYDALLPELMCMGDWSHPCSTSCYDCGFGCDEDTISCETQNPGLDCGFWYDCRDPSFGDPNEWLGEYTCMRQAMKAAVLPALRDKLNDGVLFWNYQGHANRFFLAHEEVWRDDPIAARHDVETLENFGRPFIFLGFACHLAEFDKSDEAANEDCMSEKLMNVRQFGASVPGGAVACFASSGFEFLTPNICFNQHVMDAFFFPEKAAASGAMDGGGATLPPGPSGVYQWTLGESTTRSRLMFQNSFAGSGNTRQAAQRFVLLGDPALEPNVGSPSLSVKINGLDVEDPEDGFFLDPQTAPGAVTVEVTANDGRGVRSMRVVDSEQGEIAASAYQVAVADSSSDGVAFSRSLTYSFTPRPDDYALTFQAADGSGATADFVLNVTNLFEFSGGEPAAYPSPFQDRTWLFYRLTNLASSVTAAVYTVSGRRIRELAGDGLTPNEQHQILWDGRDDRGNPVANGTYFFRFVVDGNGRSISRTVPVAKIR